MPGTPGTPTVDQSEVTARALTTAGVDAPLDLNLIIPMFELLAGGDRFKFALATNERALQPGLDIETWFVADGGGRIAQGPVHAPYLDEGLGEKGVYVVDTDVAAGIYDVVIATRDRSHAAHQTIRVVGPAESQVLRPGQDAPRARTATQEGDFGQRFLCTREPQCAMHEVSLRDALRDGRPIVITIATPKYCASEICGPVVDIVQLVRDGSERDDIAWIHSEVFTDPEAEQPEPVPVMAEFLLPSEPWTFVIGADGKVKDRFDGPCPAELLRESVATHL